LMFSIQGGRLMIVVALFFSIKNLTESKIKEAAAFGGAIFIGMGRAHPTEKDKAKNIVF
jgi:hypothetical protein